MDGETAFEQQAEKLLATPSGRYEKAKLALTEAAWAHASTDELEQELDAIVLPALECEVQD